jgi:hypothetical protein
MLFICKNKMFLLEIVWTLWINTTHQEKSEVQFFLFLYLCIFLNGTDVCTQDLALAKQELYHLSHNSSPFCFSLFPR